MLSSGRRQQGVKRTGVSLLPFERVYEISNNRKSIRESGLKRARQ